ncbi:MAG: hypothetical protein Q9M29_08335, partial [Mariprofundaceae bacterium]|nr:hypothetical protein [Mariprofundaceae bacterium]
VTGDGAALNAGTHQGVLIINSNDPDQPNINVPVVFDVVDQAIQNPVIEVTPAEFALVLAEGDSTSDTLFVRNAGGLNLNWNLQFAAGWINANPQNGSLAYAEQDTVLLSFDALNLTPGLYRDTLQVQSNDPNRPDVRVPVQLEVKAKPEPRIVVQPDSFRFVLAPGAIDSARWSIRNTGTAVLNWRIGGAVPGWIVLSDTAGAVQPGDSTELWMWGNTNQLTTGAYPTTVLIESNDPAQPQWPVQVEMVVYDPGAAFRVEPGEIVVTVAAEDSAEALIMLINNAPVAVGWQAMANAAWLVLSDTSGALAAGDSAAVRIQCSAVGLQPGVYTDTLHIVFQAAGGQRRQVAV